MPLPSTLTVSKDPLEMANVSHMQGTFGLRDHDPPSGVRRRGALSVTCHQQRAVGLHHLNGLLSIITASVT